MNTEVTGQNRIVLVGCRATPLAHYLKALGIMRLVSEQLDTACRGAWENERFVLYTRLERTFIEDFFLLQYQPTPFVSPWNGGSGFYAKDNTKALHALRDSKAERFLRYREVISIAAAQVSRMKLAKRPDAKGSMGGQKGQLLELCRNVLPDDALAWLDAAYLLTSDGPKFPPLLGTGGNDGRLEFSQNVMQRLLELFDADTGEPRAMTRTWLKGALFGEPVCGLQAKAAIGQFLPGAAGGANMGQGFSSHSLINPWDFVLMLEGALMFAAAASKRWQAQQASGTLAYPFTVRTSGVGYGSAAIADETDSRAEMWMPVWSTPASLGELSHLFAEARMKDRGKTIRNGVDFALAIARLGVDRGISAFQRFGFQVRNGLSYFAIPLERYPVPKTPVAQYTSEIDTWFDAFRRSAAGKTAPASFVRARERIDRALLDCCRKDDVWSTLGLLKALGECERLLSRRSRWATEARIAPVPVLSSVWWDSVSGALETSLELRLAASLASTYGVYRWAREASQWWPMRAFLSPVQFKSYSAQTTVSWDELRISLLPPKTGDLFTFLGRLFGARLLRGRSAERDHSDDALASGRRGLMERATIVAQLSDITQLLHQPEDVDQGLFLEALWGFSLLNWRTIEVQQPKTASGEDFPGLLYGLLKLSLMGEFTVRYTHEKKQYELPCKVPLHPSIFRNLQAGQVGESVRQAARRLRASGLTPLLAPEQQVFASPQRASYLAAGLSFVPHVSAISLLARRCCRVGDDDDRSISLTSNAIDTSHPFYDTGVMP